MTDLWQYLPSFDTFSDYTLRGAFLFLIVMLTFRFIGWITRRLILSRRRMLRTKLSDRRRDTLRALITSTVNGIGLIVSTVLILGMFVQPSALFTALGLFSAGLGFSARPYVSDVLGGIALLFEDQFALGDKVEIGDKAVIGTVERVSLRTTYIRGESGELWLVPNGDIRTIRNFSRGTWSPASIKLTVPTRKLDETLLILADIIDTPGTDVVEKPEIISEGGEIGPEQTTLTLKVKAQYGKAPLVRRAYLARIQSLLTEHHIIEDDPPEGHRQ